jgi:basic amino acid/polyamine antiporter, APA family
MIFAGSRMVAVVGRGHPVLGPLGRLNTLRSPVWAIAVTSGIAALAIVAFGSDLVRRPLRSLLQRLTKNELNWEEPDDALETLVAAMSPIVWLYFMLAALALIVLRRRLGSRPSFKTLGYPFTPIIFAATCGWMAHRGILYTQWMTLVVLMPMLLGLPLVLVGRGMRREIREDDIRA